MTRWELGGKMAVSDRVEALRHSLAREIHDPFVSPLYA